MDTKTEWSHYVKEHILLVNHDVLFLFYLFSRYRYGQTKEKVT